MRLFCFPHSGAGASVYRDWAAKLPGLAVVPVQYPGHESRFREPLHRRMEPLVDSLADELAPMLDPPFAFFGHSLGALVAFALARRLLATNGPEPVKLLISACRAPHIVKLFPPLHRSTEGEFRQVVTALSSGTSDGTGAAETLRDPELWQLFEPILRADFEVSDTYACQAEPSLACPLSALGGLNDPFVEPPALEAWGGLTRGSFRLTLFPGGHFYHLAAGSLAPEVAKAILADLAL